MESRQARRIIGGGFLAGAGLLLGKETFAWLLGKALDALSGGVPSMSGFPWFDAIALLLFISGLGLVASTWWNPRAPTPTNGLAAANTGPNDNAANANVAEPTAAGCDFILQDERTIRVGENGNIHDVYALAKTEHDEIVWYFFLLFGVPFSTRLISVVSAAPDGKQTDHLSASHIVRQTERYCIIRTMGISTPCTVRVMIHGVRP